jgi:hypothetical protein
MFVLTAQGWVEKFQADMKIGWLKPDDVIGMEYWTYDDVRDFADGDDYYGEVTDVVARKVFAEVMSQLRRYDNVDNDLVRDTISGEFDKMIGGK